MLKWIGDVSGMADVCQIHRPSLSMLDGLSSKHGKSVDSQFILDIKHFVEVILHYILSATSNKKLGLSLSKLVSVCAHVPVNAFLWE